MSREWAYVALSRGRQSNRLYVAAQPDDERAEFAPTSAGARDPVERLAAALRDSDGSGARDRLAACRGERGADAMPSETRRARRGSGERSRSGARSGCPGAAGSWTRRASAREAAMRGLAEAQRREAERAHGARAVRERARARGCSATPRSCGWRERRPSGCCSGTGASDGSSERRAEDATATRAARPAVHADAQGGGRGARDEPESLRAARAAGAEGRDLRAARADPDRASSSAGCSGTRATSSTPGASDSRRAAA